MGVGYLIIGSIVLILGAGAAFHFKRRIRPQLGWQETAGLKLTGYAERLRACAEEIDQPHADVFWDMAESLERIRVEVMADQRDLALVSRFVSYHARRIVELIEKFVQLNAKARPEHAERLEQMAVHVHGYRDVFNRVEKACIDHDFNDMEATMAALDVQLERLPF